MGIQGLIPFLKKCTRSAHISHFSGQCVAIDAYCWLHKGAYACVEKLARGEPCDAYVTYCMKLVNMLLSHNIKPILVFDGRHLPAKARTELKRRESRQQSRARAAELLRAGRTEEARNYLRRSIDITHNMAVDLMRECRAKNVDCIVAPYEADAQLAYLNLKNIAQVVITEDSDLVLFGCNMVMFKMDISGNGLLVEKEKLHLAMGSNPENFEFDKFRHMCILSGCDYLPSLPGIGLAKALKFVTKTADPDIHRALRRLPLHLNMHSLSVSNEYRDEFVQAVATFKYQLVYDPMTRKLVPLNEPPAGYEHNSYVGEMMPDDIAFQLALGNLDPFTLKPVDDFNPDRIQKHSFSTRQPADKSQPSIWTSASVLSINELLPVQTKKTDTQVKPKRIVITDTGKDIHTSGELQALYGAKKLNASPRLKDDSEIIDDDRSSEEEPHPKKQCIDDSQKENHCVSPRRKPKLPDALSPVLTQRKARNPFALSINREQIQNICNIEREVISCKRIKLFKRNVEAGVQVIRSRYFTSNNLDCNSDTTETAQKDSSEDKNNPPSDSVLQFYSAVSEKSLCTDERGKLSDVSDPVEMSNSAFFALKSREMVQCDVDLEDSLTQPSSQFTSQSSNLETQASQRSNSETQFDSGTGTNSSMSEELEKPFKLIGMHDSLSGQIDDSMKTKRTCEDTDSKLLTDATTPMVQKTPFTSVFKWRKVDTEIMGNKIPDVSETLRENDGTTMSDQHISKDNKTSSSNEDVACFNVDQRSQLKSQKVQYEGVISSVKKSPALRPLSRSIGSCRKQGLNKKDRPREKSLLQQNLLTLFACQKEKQL
ncbi:exonuclease 1 isoform X1 [Schistocerca americana]|uniref:exonuclease 1 isoform X1 n=2 Tax=Schistocerca americana TaxID=7009 RepID=UPI001F4F1D4F|nr:exonuclease 1 isoform X1 [Schistocerca americana]